MRSAIRSLSAGERRAGKNSITRGSEFRRANGSRSRVSQFLSNRRSVSMIVVPFFVLVPVENSTAELFAGYKDFFPGAPRSSMFGFSSLALVFGVPYVG